MSALIIDRQRDKEGAYGRLVIDTFMTQRKIVLELQLCLENDIIAREWFLRNFYGRGKNGAFAFFDNHFYSKR